MPSHIVVMGSLNMDLVVKTPHLPALGECVIGGPFATFPGGKGGNQSIAAARLGAQVSMIGRVGADPNGDRLIQTLKDAGVDTTFVGRDPQAATGVALITVDVSGHNTLVVALGASDRITPQVVDSCAEVLDEASLLVLQHETPMDGVVRLIELAHARHVPVVLNPGPAHPAALPALPMVDYLIPNESELRLLSGNEAIPAGIERLQSLGARRVIVTLGEQGALVADGADRWQAPAYKVEAVDTTAAGDAFIGAFSVALVDGLPLLEAVAWGNAAGALAATKMGAQPSLPTRSEVTQLRQAQPDVLPTRVQP